MAALVLALGAFFFLNKAWAGRTTQRDAEEACIEAAAEANLGEVTRDQVDSSLISDAVPRGMRSIGQYHVRSLYWTCVATPIDGKFNTSVEGRP